MVRVIAGVSMLLAAVGYPIAVYLGLTHFGLSQLTLAIVTIAGASAVFRVWAHRGQALAPLLVPPLLILGLALFGWWLRDPRWLLATPSLINLGLLLTFGQSLWFPPPLVERFARWTEPALSAAEVAYCRRVTQVWCGFFVFNATLAGFLAWAAPLTYWALYTGLISYLLVGLLMLSEYVVRKQRFRKFGNTFYDRILASWLTPRGHSS